LIGNVKYFLNKNSKFKYKTKKLIVYFRTEEIFFDYGQIEIVFYTSTLCFIKDVCPYGKDCLQILNDLTTKCKNDLNLDRVKKFL
jgi:hypothetical protein